MGIDIEKEIKAVRDSVNSGLIDDKLSGLVGEARTKTRTSSRSEMTDDEALEVAAAGDGAFGGFDFTKLSEGFEKVLDEVKEAFQNFDGKGGNGQDGPSGPRLA